MDRRLALVILYPAFTSKGYQLMGLQGQTKSFLAFSVSQCEFSSQETLCCETAACLGKRLPKKDVHSVRTVIADEVLYGYR